MHTTDSTTRTARQGRRRRLAVLAGSGTAALALALGACSGGGDDAGSRAAVATSSPATELTAFQVVQASADRSRDAGTAKFSFTVDADAAGEGALNLSGDGAFDAATGAVSVTVALPAQAGTSGPVELRLVDGTAYLSGAPLTGPGQWLRMPLEAAGAAGLDTSAVDPARQIEQLRAVADDVREVPGVTVRGVETRGYRGTIDPAEALEQLPPEQRTPEAEQAAAEVGSVPFTLYVDEEDRPARVVVDVAAEGSTAKLSMDYYDWGSDVDVQAPDPATVSELPAGMAPVQQGA